MSRYLLAGAVVVSWLSLLAYGGACLFDHAVATTLPLRYGPLPTKPAAKACCGAATKPLPCDKTSCDCGCEKGEVCRCAVEKVTR